jgi:transcriptional regulator with XRE-family HTH domain
MNFAERIERLRTEKHISQDKLANMLGVPFGNVVKWEQGRSYPSTEELIKISDIFDVSIDYLIKENEYRTYNDINDEVDEEDESDEMMMIGGFILGTAAGLVTGNLMWASIGGFAGLGIGFIMKALHISL